MHRSLLFKLGFIPIAFLIWGWRDSLRCHSYVSCDSAGHSLTAYHSFSRIHLQFYSGTAAGWPQNFGIFREKFRDGKTPFPIGNRLFPSPDFEPEVPDLPFDQLSEEHQFRAELGNTAGGITLPHWLILLTYGLLWLGTSLLIASKRKAAATGILG